MAQKTKLPLTKIARGIKKRGTEGALRRQDPTPGTKLTASDLNTLEARARRMKKEDGTMTEEGTRLFRRVQAAKRFAAARK